MKIFNQNETWEEKVNFVDENNVYLGYDLSQCCCENADWFIADEPCTKSQDRDSDQEMDMPGWVFDTTFFKQVDDESEFDSGGMAIFRIVNGDREKYIHIYNSHNGYYGHGFDFKVGQESVQSGSL
jgi:hypothetical protein